ncbi:MAG: AraC family transcriptional regulator [Lachnospiraceae bacterium]|nr:AraC family transcriptional regulator [Lachnospiraceae bacterium]
MFKLKRKLTKYDTIFNRLMLSFIGLVLIVSLCMGAGYAAQFSGEYRQKVEILEQEKIQYLGQHMDTLFGDCNNIIVDLANMANRDDALKHFLNHGSRNDFDSMNTVLKYLEILNAQYDKEVSGIEFYVFPNNMIISSANGISYTEESGTSISEEFDEAGVPVKYNSSGRYLFTREVTSNSKTDKVLSFGAHYPVFTKDISKLKGYLIVNVPINTLDTILLEYADDNSGFAALLDDKGEVVACGGDDSLFAKVLNDKLPGESSDIINGSVNAAYNYDGMILISQPLAIPGWKVVSVTPADEYYKDIRILVRRIALLSLIIVVVGLIIAYRFAKRVYNPIGSMVNKLDGLKLARKAKENELLYLDRTINELCVLVGNKDEAYKERVNVVRHDLVREIINSSDISDERIDKILEEIGDKNEYVSHFCMVATFHGKVMGKVDEPTRNAMTYNMTKYLEDYEDEEMRCMSLDLYNGRVVIIASCMADGEDRMENLYAKFKDFVKITFNIDLVVWQSGPVYKLSQISSEYAKISKAMEYDYYIPYRYRMDLATMDAEEVKILLGDKDTQSFFDPRYDSFAEALVSNDAETVKAILEEYNKAAMLIQGTSEYMNSISMRYLFLFNHFLRDIMKKSKTYDDSQLLLELTDVFDVDDFCNWLYKKILWAFETAAQNKTNPTDNVVELVEKIVREHLDEDISLDYVASKVYLAPKYLSRLFKEEKGLNFTQFVNDCKMEEASKLLIETDKTLEEIITVIGFNSTNYFIKKFKDSYDVTPAQYRRSHRIERENL